MRRRRVLCGAKINFVVALCCACAVLLPRTPLHAQVLRIQARDSATNAPLSYVLLEIRGETGELALSTMTGDDGTRTVRLPRAGEYRIQLRRVGFRTQSMGPVRVSGGETLPLVFQAVSIPAALPAVRVAEKDQCDVISRSDDDARRVVALWEQMQTAFRLNELAQAESLPGTRRMRMTGYVAHGSIGRRATFRHTVQPTGSNQTVSVDSYSSDDISKNGYVRYDDNRVLYIAPVERVLLVNAFVNEHCFRLVPGTDANAGLVGLAFKPKPSRRVPEIAGTMWADQQSGTPRYVEFWFLDNRIAPVARGPGKTGGEVYFGQLPDETWATIGWRLRMPTALGYVYEGEGVILTEVGGIAVSADKNAALQTLVPATPAYAAFAEQFLPGLVTAQVLNGETLRPLKDAVVTLRQYPDTSATSFETDGDARGLGTSIFAPRDTIVFSDESGRVQVGGLPPGVYEVRFSPADAERSPVQPASVDITVKPHGVTSVQLVTPRTQQLLGRCGNDRLKSSVYGVVRLGEGPVEPFATTTSASVTAYWNTPDGKQLERLTFADAEGRYFLCDVPKDVSLRLRAVLGGRDHPRARTDDKVAHVEVQIVLGEWQMTYLPLQIPAKD